MRLLDLYHRLPYPGRVLAASLRGYQLRRFRYDGTTERRVAEALERDHWDAERWRRYHEEHLAAVLERAARRVPFYRRHWKGREGWQDLASWPVLAKASVREEASAFVPDGLDPRRLYEEHTSGSTGTPLRLFWSREAAVAWFALFEARLRRWHGLSRHDRWAILGGQLVAPASRTRPPFWVWNQGLSQLYLSAYHLEPKNTAAYLDALRRHRVRYLLGYPSAMAVLARFAREQGLEAPRLDVVLSNAEPLFPSQRQVLAEVFRCPVRDTYGSAELAGAASECEHGSLHLWPEVAVLEVQDDGEVLSTGLLNDAMPLVRYRLDDRLRRADEDAACLCGRRLPILRSVDGRRDEVVVTPEGRRVGRLDPVFKADLPIHEAQIVQESVERLTLRVVPARGFGADTAADLERRLRERLGPSIAIDVEEVERLERGAAGKLRAVVSRVAN